MRARWDFLWEGLSTARTNYGGLRGHDELAVILWRDSVGLMDKPLSDHNLEESVYSPLRAIAGQTPLVPLVSGGGFRLEALCAALRPLRRTAAPFARPASGSSHMRCGHEV